MLAKIKPSRLTRNVEPRIAEPVALSPSVGYSLAIFDFDGTLADSVTWFVEVFNEVARRYRFKQATRAELETLRGQDAPSVLRELGVARWKLPLIARHMRRLMARDIDKIALFPGAVELLRELDAAGVRLAIVSSNSRANVSRLLGAGTTALIEDFACGASLFGKTAKFREVLERTKVAPARVIAFGDEVRDIEAAETVGIASGAVAWGYATRDVLAARRPTVILDSLAAIAPFILDNR